MKISDECEFYTFIKYNQEHAVAKYATIGPLQESNMRPCGSDAAL